MYLCSDIGDLAFLHNWLLANALYLMLDMCFAAADAALHADSQITALKCTLPKLACWHHFQLPLLANKYVQSALYVVRIGMKVKW